MTDVVFAFDVEDPVNPSSDDAVLRLCDLFAEEGAPVSLFIAAEKARVLRARGREDVIAGMARHEICYHGNYWGDFPVPALEYGQDLDWDAAVAYALSVETPGLHDVAEITGKFPVAWCVHQAQWCPQLAYALKLAGVRCCAGGPRGWIMNWLSWGRAHCTLSSQPDWQLHVDPTCPEEVKPTLDVERELADFARQFEQLSAEQRFITIAGHPTSLVTAEWGGLTSHAQLFRDGGPGFYPRPPGIRPSRPRSAEDIEAAFEFIRQQIRWVKSRQDVNLTGYAALCERDEEREPLWIDFGEVRMLADRMLSELNYVVEARTTFSCADVYGMLTWTLNYCLEQGRWPERVPVQRLLGPVDEPLSCTESVTLTRENIFAGAAAAYATMMDKRRIPGMLRASMIDVGPGTWLRAMATFVRHVSFGDPMPLQVTVAPGPELPDCAEESVITHRRFASSNRRPGLSVEPLLALFRRQSWSYRPAVRSE